MNHKYVYPEEGGIQQIIDAVGCANYQLAGELLIGASLTTNSRVELEKGLLQSFTNLSNRYWIFRDCFSCASRETFW